MRASELRDKPTSDLLERSQSLRAEVFNLKFQLATEQLTQTAKLVGAKRDLARVMTVLRERELGMHAAPDAEAAESEEA